MIPNSVTNIGTEAFFGCTSLASIAIPNSVLHIPNSAFEDCLSLTDITLPSSVTDIGTFAFWGCSSLAKITIPGSVTTIGDSAFYLCGALTRIYFKGNAPGVDSAAFSTVNATVYYLPGTAGWGTAFDGLTTALWRPQIQTSAASFGLLTNQFGFNINWASGMVVVVEASATLPSPVWSPLQTNTLISDSLYFSDPQWTKYPRRFYRIHSP